jgi:pimeloyl-ACP methyl ester carboxylesterase
MRYRSFAVLALALVASAEWSPAVALPPVGESRPEQHAQSESVVDTPSDGAPTLGGRIFWTDRLLFHDWRIQRNALFGHCRLLDPDNRRHAWGSFDSCRHTLESIKRQRQLPPMRGRAIVLLHGLADPRQNLKGIKTYLEGTGRFTVLNFTYASTQGGVGAHAAALASVIENLEGIEEINFVAHSLGNIVVRHYLRDQTDQVSGRGPDPRIKRMVMLGPPNRGAHLAERFGGNGIYRFFTGPSGEQLGARWQELEAKLATPACQFGIIAGGSFARSQGNPLIEGDDDFVVGVEETRLPGARDFIVLPVLHATMMNDRRVRECTLRFLEEGHFVSEQTRQPILESQTAH